mmetsp:Transcript_134525/g.348495  ORF Transcript_134525/g.348495 Transcript_134525/m.348495 type:complete len:224 (+) Transcript_134525:1542-2213(+)
MPRSRTSSPSSQSSLSPSSSQTGWQLTCPTSCGISCARMQLGKVFGMSSSRGTRSRGKSSVSAMLLRRRSGVDARLSVRRWSRPWLLRLLYTHLGKRIKMITRCSQGRLLGLAQTLLGTQRGISRLLVRCRPCRLRPPRLRPCRQPLQLSAHLKSLPKQQLTQPQRRRLQLRSPLQRRSLLQRRSPLQQRRAQCLVENKNREVPSCRECSSSSSNRRPRQRLL